MKPIEHNMKCCGNCLLYITIEGLGVFESNCSDNHTGDASPNAVCNYWQSDEYTFNNRLKLFRAEGL